MAKCDIQDAFFLLPIHQNVHYLLEFHWEEKNIISRFCPWEHPPLVNYLKPFLQPMGASSSCQLFETFSTALQWILNAKFYIQGVSHLLDDFFFVGKALNDVLLY